MIQIKKENTTKTSGVMESMIAGIQKEGMSVIANLLRSQIYKDSILATIRETVSNSTDANVAAGNGDLPIQVTLPSRFNPVFKTKDMGKGLSDSDIKDIYLWYGCSTKGNSNEFTGCLGIGRFAPLSYTDSFIITSFVNGTKNVFNVFIDSTDNNQIAKIHSESTTEPNGVEISVAVKDSDIQLFHDKAMDLFRHFKVKPIVNGSQVKYDEAEPIMKGVDWKITGKSSLSIGIMGNVPYALDNHFTGDESITNALNCGIEVDFAIGELDVSASREGLKYNDRTKKAIKDKLTRIVCEASAELNKKFKSCNTLFDAHKLYGEVMDYGSNLYALRNLVKSSLVFNGVKITSSRINFTPPTDGSYGVKTFEKTWRGNKIRSYDSQSIECNANTLVIDNDLYLSSGVRSRIHAPVSSGKKVWLVTYRTAADKAKFLSDSGLIEANLVKLSSFPKISLAVGNSSAVKDSKHTSKEFVYDFSFAGKASSWHSKLSDFWKSENVDVANDSGFYVIIDRFQFKNHKGLMSAPSELSTLAKSLKTFGIDITKIYGFKQKHEAEVKTNKNMVNLFDYISNELTIYFDKNKIAEKVADRINYDENVCDWVNLIQKHGSKANDKTLFSQTALIADKMQHKKEKIILDAAVAFKEYFKPATASNDMAKLVVGIHKTYPLFNHIRIWGNDTEKTAVDSIIQYVNLIDG